MMAKDFCDMLFFINETVITVEEASAALFAMRGYLDALKSKGVPVDKAFAP